MMDKRKIEPAGCPEALGPYSPALAMGGMVFISGQVAQTPVPDVAGQTRQALAGLDALLRAAALRPEDVAMVNVYLRDVERDFDAMNQVYRQYFSEPYPARVTVEAKLAEPELLVEISALAVQPRNA